MLWPIFEIGINFYQAFLLVYFVKKRFVQDKRLLWIDSSVLLLIGTGLTLFQYIDTVIPDTILFAIPFFYALFTTKDKWYTCLLWSLVLTTVFLGTVVVVGNSFAAFTSLTWDELLEQTQTRIAFVLATNVALTVAISIVANIGNTSYIVSRKATITFLVLLILEFSTNEMLYVLQVNYHDEQPLYVYASICILVTAILTIGLYEMMNIAAYRQTQTDLALQTAQLVQAHQGELRSIYENMLSMQHDLRHRITAAEQMLEQQSVTNHDQVVSLLHNTDILDEYITGCISMDAILTAKSSLMKKNGIVFEYSPYPLKNLPIDENDFCILMSNIIDNAIEGVMRLPVNNVSRKITLGISQASDMLSIVCKNDVDISTINKEGDEFISSKDHSEIHGFGTRSIKTIVHQAGGWVDFQIKETLFIVSILLPIGEK